MMKKIPLLLVFSLLAACSSMGVDSNSKAKKTADIYLEAGTESLYQGRYTDALNSLSEALKYDPKSTIILNNLALAYVGKEKEKLAEDTWKKTLALDPNFSDARNNLGFLYLRQSRYKEAEKEFNAVIKDIHYTKVHQTYFNLGQLYLAQNKVLLAEQNFNLAIKNNEKFCPAWYKIGTIQKDRGQLDLAAASFKKAIAGTCFSNPQTHFEIGSLYLKTNDTKRAKEKFLEIIEFFPQSDWAKKAELTLNMIR